MRDSKFVSAMALGITAAVSFIVSLLWRGFLEFSPLGFLFYAGLAALSAFLGYFTVFWGFLCRIRTWQIRAVVLGLAVVVAAHVWLGALTFLLSGGETFYTLGYGLFATSSPVTIPLTVLMASILEWRR